MRATILEGDMREQLRTLADNSVDAVVTDAPYELGFMGAKWDATGVAYDAAAWAEVLRVLKPGGHLAAFGGTRTYHRMAVAIENAGFEIRDQLAWAYGSGFPKSHKVGQKGWGTALKPAWEPICLARKPLSEKSIAANVLKWGTGALNIDGCRIGTDGGTTRSGQAPYGLSGWRTGHEIVELDKGRWPANLCHDGSDEVLAGFPAEAGAFAPVKGTEPSEVVASVYRKRARVAKHHHGDSGSAARFFYCAKAGKLDRLGSTHPTVKPVSLLQWLVRMLTPPSGTVLDPFAGTGTTGLAAFIEGLESVLVEMRAEAVEDIRQRIAHVQGLGRIKAMQLAQPEADEKKHAKAQGHGLPLFGGSDA